VGRSAYLAPAARAQAVAMLVDVSDCIGCKACEVACKQWNQNKAETPAYTGSYQSHTNLSSVTWTLVRFREGKKANGDMDWTFHKYNCMHCTDAECIEACPVGALFHSDNGVVNLDFDKCTGCGYCEEECPYDAVHVNAQLWNTKKKAGKCTLCYDRITNGLNPACVQACPTDCIKYGARDELIRWGQERVATLKRRGYPNATLYGVNEKDGLHELYVLTDTPAAFGLQSEEEGRSEGREFSKRAFVGRWVRPAGKVLLGSMLFGLLANLIVNRFVGLKETKDGEDRA
jgi:formate dehydrogenase iron-sulfur subunit